MAMKRVLAIFSALCLIEFALISVIRGFAPIPGERTSIKYSLVACCSWYSALHLVLSLFLIYDVDIGVRVRVRVSLSFVDVALSLIC